MSVTIAAADYVPVGPIEDIEARLQQYEGLIIDTVLVDTRNIYDLTEPKYQKFLFRWANRLHIVTREHIVRQELLLHSGDRFSAALAAETARNLRTRFPLNEAWVEVARVDSQRVLMHVVTVDQWSLVGGLRSVNRDGQETDYQIGFEERNFLGRAQFLSADFYARENDPDYGEFQFREPRLLGRRLAVGFVYRGNPRNVLRSAYISRPYYALSQHHRASIYVAGRENVNERFTSDGRLAARWHTEGENVEIDYGYRWGPSRRKIELSGQYDYLVRSVSGPVEVFDHSVSLEGVVTDSIYHFFAAGAELRTQRFVVERRIRGFDYAEDIRLGLTIAGSYGRAFRPSFDTHYYDVLTGEVSFTHIIGFNLFNITLGRSVWFRGDNHLRGVSALSMFYYNNWLPFLTVAARTLYRADRDGADQRLIIGGKSGLRGYKTELMAGNRLHVMNLEGRFFPGIELLSVKIGAATFADFGRTWRDEEALTIKDYRFSVGAGLRLSLEKLRRGEIIRLDVAVIEDGRVELSFATGQYF